MREVIDELRDIEGVKNVKRHSNTLKINLFSRPIPGSEAVELSGDLRKISQSIVSVLDGARSSGSFENWEWVQKPEKQYEKTKLGKKKVSDRKDGGHKPGFYRVSIRK